MEEVANKNSEIDAEGEAVNSKDCTSHREATVLSRKTSDNFENGFRCMKIKTTQSAGAHAHYIPFHS